MNSNIIQIKNNFYSTKQSQKLFDILKNELQWSKDKYVIMGKTVYSPRLTSYYGDKSYTYTGQTKQPKKIPQILIEMIQKIENELNYEKGYFNTCLLNYYKDGKDYMGYHKDNEPEIKPNTDVIIISFGVKRRFYIKEDKTKIVTKYELDNGSVCILKPDCQKQYNHSIPKMLKVTQDRISVTFRNFK